MAMPLLARNLYRFGPFDLDQEQRVVRRDGTKIALPPKAFDLLLYLVQNPLRLITKEELLRAVWPDSFVEEGNLTQNIFLLRKALNNPREDSRYIVTLPGRGYQFGVPVIIEEQPQSEPAQMDSLETRAAAQGQSTLPVVSDPSFGRRAGDQDRRKGDSGRRTADRVRQVEGQRWSSR